MKRSVVFDALFEQTRVVSADLSFVEPTAAFYSILQIRSVVQRLFDSPDDIFSSSHSSEYMIIDSYISNRPVSSFVGPLSEVR